MKLKGYFEALAFIALLHLVKGNNGFHLKTTGSGQQWMREMNVATRQWEKFNQTSFSTFNLYKNMQEMVLKAFLVKRRRQREIIKTEVKSCRKLT